MALFWLNIGTKPIEILFINSLVFNQFRMSLLDDLKYKLTQKNAVVRIIALNVLVYLVFALAHVLFWLFQANDILSLVEKKFVLYANLNNFIMQPWGIITYMFFHDGFFHILFNMLWLYWLGMLLHEYLGNTRV